MPDFEWLREFGRDIGLAGVLLVILIGGYRKWWVFGWAYTEAVQQREEWKAMALGQMKMANKALRLGETKVVPDAQDG